MRKNHGWTDGHPRGDSKQVWNVDLGDHEAVALFLEQNVDKIPREEIDRIISVLVQRNAVPPPHARTDATGLPQPGLADFPNLDDARREATFYEQLQQVRANDYSRKRDSEYRARELGRLLSRVAVSVFLGVVLWVMPDGFSATSVGRMTQISLAVTSTMSVLLAMDYFVVPFTQRWRRATPRPGRAARQAPP